METVTLLCRGVKLVLPIKEIESFTDQVWFLKLLVQYEDDGKPIELCEDINIVLSIIETLKYHKLILYNSISLEHMYMLCDKWCVPEWILEEITSRIELYSKSETEKIKNEKIYKCSVCYIGYKHSENTSTSCKKHLYSMDTHANIFACCNNQEPCIKGYHIGKG